VTRDVDLPQDRPSRHVADRPPIMEFVTDQGRVVVV
jgi:hypothetical protein